MSKSMTHKYNLYSADFGNDAYQIYAQMRRDDPVYEYERLPQNDPILRWLGIDGPRIWFVSRYSEAEQVLRDGQTFVCDQRLVSAGFDAGHLKADSLLNRLSQNHLLSLDGADHLRLRSLVKKAFSPGTVRALRPKIEQLANHYLDKVAENDCMELISDYAFPLSITVIAELLGIPTDRRDDFRHWADAVFVTDNELPVEREQLVQEFDDYVRRLINERRQNPAKDLLSRLILAQIEGEKLSEIELHSMVFLLLIAAGHQTTMSAIGNAVWVLLQHPEMWKALHDDPSLMPNAVEELLRFESPTARTPIPHWVTCDVELGGHLLRKGDLVFAIISSANRDESHFNCAATLDFKRQSNSHLAFGLGAHYCLGAPLARLEVQIALNTLIQRLPDLQLDFDGQEIVWRPTPSLRSMERLPVRWNIENV